MTTITRSMFRESLRDREVALDGLADATPRVMERLRAADVDGDGKIAGSQDIDAAFVALDSFDRNGSRASLGAARGEDRGVRAAQALMRAATPVSPRPSRGLAPSEPGSEAAGSAARVRTDSTLASYAGGVGPIRVAHQDGKPAAVQFQADMDVDTDGGSSATSRSDRHYQSQTSMRLGGRSLDADQLPFVVLPPALARATGAKLGDLVEVEQGGRKMYAIYGDNGPSRKIGEASIYVARAFDPKAGPNRAAAGTFTYTVLPGSGAAAGIRNGGAAWTAAEIQEAGARAFAEARARGLVT